MQDTFHLENSSTIALQSDGFIHHWYVMVLQITHLHLISKYFYWNFNVVTREPKGLKCFAIVFFVATCVPLNGPKNGIVSYDMSPINNRYPVGTIATYSCNPDYIPSNHASARCHKKGTVLSWKTSDVIPTCSGRNIHRYFFTKISPSKI